MSYPYLSDLIRALTGLDIPLPFPMFGLLVACAMIAAAASLTAELKRMHAAGQVGMARRKQVGKDGSVTWIASAPQDIVSNLTLVVIVAEALSAVPSVTSHLPSPMLTVKLPPLSPARTLRQASSRAGAISWAGSALMVAPSPAPEG